MTIESDFLAKTAPLANGCIEWRGGVFKRRGGYGACTMRAHGIIQQRAHRVAWAIFKHPITPDQHVLHDCDNPLCVNIDHLFLGDQQANMADKVSKGRQLRGGSHPMAKISEAQAIAIRCDPRKYTEIAEAYGVSVPTISDIKRARSWPHLGPPVGRYNRAA